MAIQITIIGLGQVGASIGLALGRVKDQAKRIGNDREPTVGRQAERLGAVDKIAFNLPGSVMEADVVILALPVDEIYETMKVIAPDLKPGCVLIDTSPSKAKVMEWASELLPGEDRYFVSLTPSLNPAYLMETERDVTKAHPDLFKNSLMLVTSLPGIDESALTLASNITSILGATPMFSDAVEADGLMAYSHLLPRLVSVALVNATTDQPGWREARKMAGHAYAQATEPALHLDESKELGASALYNPENTVRMLDQMITALRDIRDAISKQDSAALNERLEHGRNSREEWWNQRINANWDPKPTSNVHLPTSGEVIGRLFGIRPGKQQKDKDQK